jgi:hypothetical protein
LFDEIGQSLSMPLKAFELFTGKSFSGAAVGSSAAAASSFVKFLVERSAIKGLVKIAFKLGYMIYKSQVADQKAAIAEKIKAFEQAKVGGKEGEAVLLAMHDQLEQYRSSPFVALHSDAIATLTGKIEAFEAGKLGGSQGDSFLQGLHAASQQLDDELILCNSLEGQLDELVTMFSNVVVALLNRHDLSKHGGLIGYFLELIVHPEKKVDSSLLMQHLLASTNALLDELPEFYGSLIPGILEALTRMQKLA